MNRQAKIVKNYMELWKKYQQFITSLHTLLMALSEIEATITATTRYSNSNTINEFWFQTEFVMNIRTRLEELLLDEWTSLQRVVQIEWESLCNVFEVMEKFVYDCTKAACDSYERHGVVTIQSFQININCEFEKKRTLMNYVLKKNRLINIHIPIINTTTLSDSDIQYQNYSETWSDLHQSSYSVGNLYQNI